MWQRDAIPGFADAQDSERTDRALAFIGITELICGLECAPLTPRRLEWLRAYSNPFIIGGVVTLAQALQFLWIVNPKFAAGAEGMATFLAENAEVDLEDASEEIGDYLDRAFLDSPTGEASIPYYSSAADLITAMASEPFRWEMDKTLDTPLPVIYQLLKCHSKSRGAVVVNQRSDKCAGDWLAALNAPEAIAERLREKEGVTNG